MESEEYKSQEYDENQKVSEDELINTYQQYFDHNAAIKLLVRLRKATRNKPKIISGTAGAIVSALGKLISALDNPSTPKAMKALIIGSIGYIILPVDLIPDAIPGIGFADDLASTAAVVAAVGIYSDFSLEKLDAYIDSLEK